MEVTYPYCAGLDVHKKTVVACCLTLNADGELVSETRTFGTTTAELLALSDWLTHHQVTHVAMESTGEFWKPVYNLLETAFEVLVVNAQHIKQVPGRKTDVQDAAWIADLLRHGLLQGSFIPPLPQRDLLDLTRQRTILVQERANVVNRLQKVLEWANLKLSAVVTDILGVSARAMLEAILAGQTDGALLADLARGRMRSKRAALEQALTGLVRPHHCFMIASHLAHIDFLEEQIAEFDTHIDQHLRLQSVPVLVSPTVDEQDAARPSAVGPVLSAALSPLTWEQALALLDTIPGVARPTAEVLLAEVGADMRRFPSAAHLASWAKVAPGNRESAGKRLSGHIGHGSRWLRSGLVQAAHGAIRVKGSYFRTVYQQLARRRGAKRALMAVAHKILIAAYHILLKQEPYRPPTTPALNDRRKAQLAKQARLRLERLGYQVNLVPLSQPAA